MCRLLTQVALAVVTFSLPFATVIAASPPVPPTAEAAKIETKVGPNEVAIYIGDMHCNNCAKKIAAKLYRVKGVVKVRTSVKDNIAVVTPQAKKQIDAKAAWAAVSKAGFEPTRMISPQGEFVANEKTKEPEKVVESEAPAQS